MKKSICIRKMTPNLVPQSPGEEDGFTYFSERPDCILQERRATLRHAQLETEIRGGGSRKLALEVEHLSSEFEAKAPNEIIVWAAETFWPDIAVSSSFQTQSLPLLHMVSQVAPQLPILFLDTGFHFPETLAFRDKLVREWGLNLRVLKAGMPREEFLGQYGGNLYRRDPDLCCFINKVEPMQQAMKGLRAWMSGIRRDQSAARSPIQIVEGTPQGVIRVHPLGMWTQEDIQNYIREHSLPGHPLSSRGYASIGCAPCTRPVQAGENERAGRWVGQGKKECGLHTQLRLVKSGAPVAQPTRVGIERREEGETDHE